ICALHPGQLVDVAASLTSCFRLHSKHATTRLRGRPQSPSNRFGPAVSATDAGETSSFPRSFSSGFGADGEKERPHWRHIVLFAATYSICLKPQCGHSTLALAGDDLITSSGGEGQNPKREPRRQAWLKLRGEQLLAGCRMLP